MPVYSISYLGFFFYFNLNIPVNDLDWIFFYMPDTYLYLLVDLASFTVPFLFSFEKKWLHFIGRWKCILAGLLSMFVFFIIWDILFTRMGIWGFNDRYISGIKFKGLPLEEFLFFLMIGFCCLFVYESMNHIMKIKWQESISRHIFTGIALINIVIAMVHYSKWYTVTALGLNGVFILAILIFVPWFSWNKFLLGYVISFIPFTIVNGILTGGFTPEPVVWYNDAENLKIRLGTIPIEDSQYMMLMMTMSIVVYEWCRRSYSTILPKKDGLSFY